MVVRLIIRMTRAMPHWHHGEQQWQCRINFYYAAASSLAVRWGPRCRAKNRRNGKLRPVLYEYSSPGDIDEFNLSIFKMISMNSLGGASPSWGGIDVLIPPIARPLIEIAPAQARPSRSSRPYYFAFLPSSKACFE